MYIRKKDALKYGKLITEDYINRKDINKYLDIIKKDLNIGDDTSFDRRSIIKLRNIYLKEMNDYNLNFQVKLAYEFEKRYPLRPYNLDFFKKMLKLNKDELLTFVKENNISNKTINSIKEVYSRYFEEETSSISKLNHVLNNAYPKQGRQIDYKKDVTDNIKEMLKEYLMTDTENITSLFSKYNVNQEQFHHAMNRDVITDNEYNKLKADYRAKREAVIAMHEDEVKRINNFIINGVPVDNSDHFIKFNEVLYYMNTKTPIKDFLSYASHVLNPGDFNRLNTVFRSFSSSKTYENPDDLIENSYCRVKGKELDDETKRKLICFMKDNNMPISEHILYSAFSMYVDGLIDPQVSSFKR